jgi:hypothetical protein
MVILVLIFTVLSALGLMSIERILEKPVVVSELEAVEVEPELEWMEEEWHNQQYVDMIHLTRHKEEAAFGYVVSPCQCPYHKKMTEREEFLNVDIDKVNAATRAQKQVTYKTYFNSKDDPAWKPTVTVGYDRLKDSLGREHIANLRIPPARYHPNRYRSDHGYIDRKLVDKVIPTTSLFGPDPYSRIMRLKEDEKVLISRIKDVSSLWNLSNDPWGNAALSTREVNEYKKLVNELEDLRVLIAKEEASAEYNARRSVRRGSEIDEYVVQDGSGRVIKRWRNEW